MLRTCEGLGRKGRQATEELIRKKAMEVVCVCVFVHAEALLDIDPI